MSGALLWRVCVLLPSGVCVSLYLSPPSDLRLTSQMFDAAFEARPHQERRRRRFLPGGLRRDAV